MLAVQLPPPSLSSFPTLLSPLAHRRSMSGSPPAPPAHTSVFNALGSYADRIKENTNKPSRSGNASPNGPSTTPPIPSSSASVKKTPVPPMPEPKSLAFPPADPEDDGRWETVQTGRNRPRNEDKRATGSESKNWRERAGPKEPVAEDESWTKVAQKAPKEISAKPGPVSGDKVAKTRTSTAPTSAPAIGSKSVWGSLGGQAAARSQPSTAPAPAQAVPAPILEAVTPSSPSLNGTTVTNNSSSPNMTSETTLPTSTPSNGSVTSADGPPAEPVPAPAPKIAAIPAVNPWEERKKKMTPSAALTQTPSSSLSSIPIPSSHTSSSSGRILQFGSVSPPQPTLKSLPNGHADDTVKVAAAQKKPRAAPTTASSMTSSTNTAMWPDVAQAAEVSKLTDDKKDRAKERKDSETSTAVEESPVTGKKTKWTAIPADELQAAADEAAETRRRQAAVKRKAAKAESSTSPAKAKSRKSSMESRKGRSNSGSLRLPPMPANAVKGAAPSFRPVFGTATSDATSSVEEVGTTMSAPLSRQTSRQSVGQSSRLSRTQLPSPSSQALNLDTASMRLGAGPFGRSTHTIPSAPLPGPQFSTPNGAGQYTRPPRNREGRQSFSGPTGPVGRGSGRGFRSASAHRGPKGFASPPGALQGLPSDNLYARGYGMGYGFVPQPMGPMTYGANAQYEAWNAQYPQFVPQRGAMPPPPMPVTMVAGLDPLRVYVLGQVEYYFSMQNLAMDFFLRQQMDSEGWIDIPTIASFNRVKNLTTEVPIVKEVMELSSLLEVREDKVRLAYGESKRWVLPEAKPSSFPADPLESFQTMSPPSDAATAELAMSISGLGIEEMPGSGNMNGSAVGSLPKYASGEVENALMKSVPPSSSASLLNGDGSTGKGETMTPATSMSEGESNKEETTT